MTIWLVQVMEYRLNISSGQVLLDDRYTFSFRVAGTQSQAEEKADEVLNAWLTGHPGQAASYSISAWLPRTRD